MCSEIQNRDTAQVAVVCQSVSFAEEIAGGC